MYGQETSGASGKKCWISTVWIMDRLSHRIIFTDAIRCEESLGTCVCVADFSPASNELTYEADEERLRVKLQHYYITSVELIVWDFCPSSVCGIDYLWRYCMGFFQILVVASPGPYAQIFIFFFKFFFEPPSRLPNSLMPSAKLRSANLPFLMSLVWRGWGSNPGLPHAGRSNHYAMRGRSSSVEPGVKTPQCV